MGAAGDVAPGRVVAAFGRRCLVEDAAGACHACIPRGKRLRIVCGDRVAFTPPADGERAGVVERIEPRDNVLERPNLRGRNEVLAANLSQVVVVIAPEPAPDPFMADRYLAQAALMGCEALIVCNKADLPTPPALGGALAEWRAAGYPVRVLSARDPSQIDALADALAGHTSILVGQSGVGKSSLLNALAPQLDLATGALSDASGEGRHTTTAARMHRLANGARVIDSPGVRDYAPGLVAVRDVARGYREIDALAGACRFADCRHLREPGCAVRAAVDAGDVAPRRYESYRRLVRLMESLGEAARPG